MDILEDDTLILVGHPQTDGVLLVVQLEANSVTRVAAHNVMHPQGERVVL